MRSILILLVMLSSYIFSENINGHKFHHEPFSRVKPLAWESYNIRETLELLYGENRLYEKSDDIHIKLPTNTEEHFKFRFKSTVSISTDKKVKSIAILQQKDKERALAALYYPYGNTVNITLPLKILNAYLTKGMRDLKVVIVIESVNNRLYMHEYPLNYSYFCDQGYEMNQYFEDLREDLDKNVLRTKYSLDENRTGTLKFMMEHPMVSYEEAEKLMVKANFISHINASIKNKKLFDLYTSGYIKRKPIFIMEFPNMKRGESINLSYSTINGEVKSKKVMAKDQVIRSIN